MSLLKNVTIGQYYPGDSVVHRLDPRTKLGLSFAFIIVLFLVKGFLPYHIGKRDRQFYAVCPSCCREVLPVLTINLQKSQNKNISGQNN